MTLPELFEWVCFSTGWAQPDSLSVAQRTHQDFEFPRLLGALTHRLYDSAVATSALKTQIAENAMDSVFLTSKISVPARRLGPIVLFILVAACAAAPVAPTASLAAAELAIQRAESDGAGQLATAELDRARQSLARANSEIVMDQMAIAKRYADEARVTAELASARSEAIKAAAINDEMKRSSEALLEEIRRAGGTK